MTSPDSPPGESSPRTPGDDPKNRRSPGAVELDQVWHMSIELIAAVLAWGGIGWLLDRLLGTGVWLTWSGLMVGTAAGLYLVSLRGDRREEDRAERDDA